jgi:CoA:oxalate CoA-transferase
VLAGTHAFGVIVAALLRRARTGAGAYLDVSMLEALVAAEDLNFGAILNGGPELRGARSGMVVHRVGGRWLAMQTVGAPQLWPRLVKLMGRLDLAEDPRFSTPIRRRQHWGELRAIITEWLDGFPTADEALEALSGARLPCAPVLAPPDVVAHPHLAARRFFPEIPHPARGRVRVTASPYHIDGHPIDPAGPAPYRPGEHTRLVLAEVLGYPSARIDELIASGVVHHMGGPEMAPQPPPPSKTPG